MSGLSIIIPCRNTGDWLAQTIRSALAQTRPPDEIIVVDDGSTDDSASIAASFGAPVRVVTGPATGAADARNHGAALTTGERLMFLDADDLLVPPTLFQLSQALDNEPRAGLAICPWDRYEFEGFGWIATPPTAALPRPGQDRLAAWLTGCWSPPCCILWTRAAFERSGGWLQEAGLDDDGNLLRRALARGIDAVDAPHGLALYRRLLGKARSYSARRLEPFGLRSRLASLVDTANELEQSGALPRYRAPLNEALAALHEDAGTEPAIATAVGDLITRIGGARRTRSRIHARAGRLGARASAWVRERTTPPRCVPDPSHQGSRQKLAHRAADAWDAARVSVIIPTYNRAQLVERAIASVLRQTHPVIEVIVVDDGSTDETPARLARNGDARVKVIRQDNAGVAAARNRGIKEATGDFVSFIDSDDEWRDDKLAKQLAALSDAPSHVGLCVTGGFAVTDGGVHERRWSPSGRLFEPLLVENTIFAGIGALVRSCVFEAVGGFDPSLPAIEDWDWLQRVARLYDFVAVDEPLFIYHDADQPGRRSTRFRANLDAREMLWRRNRHALRRAGLAQRYLLESARRELRESDGLDGRGRRLVLRALAERPQNIALMPWLSYMAMPFAMRAALRQVDAKRRKLVVRE